MKAMLIRLTLIMGFLLIIQESSVFAQCNLSFTATTHESRCKSTGEILVTTTGGSGNYNYKVTRGSFSTVTSTNLISGLAAGVYVVEVKDLVSGCVSVNTAVEVEGNYEDPRFQLVVTDISCINSSDGALSVANLQYGRGPFTFTIVAPSAASVGASNTTGNFTNLPAGDYYVRLTDSCGGIQTRAVTISNYNWLIDSKTVSKIGCDSADASVVLQDSKGNLNTSGTIFNSYTYGVTRAAGDTVWFNSRTFRFYKGNSRSVMIVAKDLCGNIRTSAWTETTIPSVAASVTINNQVCSGFTATVTGQTNLTSPQYCLYNNANVLISCNSTGVFSNTPYGSYCIRVRDNCYDTTISRCFVVNPPAPAVAANVSISNLGCSNFTATITGQQNLTSPQYCLYNSSNVLVSCNTTGSFTNVPYGSYCIRITDGCNGTVINRCFTQNRPVPSVSATVPISNRGCSTFTATVNGQANINNGQYCIYNSSGVLIACNGSGIFNNLPYGTYCINVQNNPLCYDTLIVRCFTVNRPVPTVAAAVTYSSQTCTSFTASITGQQNLNNPQYCLYNSSNALVSCNTTGQFTGLAYGSYCIRVSNNASCYDTTIQRCFTVNRPIPAIAAAVSISNKNCAGFTATITGQQNLTTPQYCLYNSSNVQVACNNTGVFTNVPYGTYCIYTINTCYDTTITRCFNVAPTPMALSISAAASCTIGTTDFTANWAATTSPYTLRVYNPGGLLVRTVAAPTNTSSITGLQGLPAGMQYKVVITDQCGNRDSTMVTPNASWLNKSVNTNSKCPSGTWQNGSGDLTVFCQYSNGAVTPKLIKKNAATINVTHNFNTGNNYSFNNMEPATYVVEYTLQNCSGKVYDTFNLQPYSFPSLQQSGVYQCNNSSFGVNAVVSGGLAPFSYEIIGSFPSTPAIVTSPQGSPSFNLNNGNSYSLVRLRSIDACGNATINDASILPLANTLISASSNCFYNNITLNVDTIPNATYTWYRRTGVNDSVQISSNQAYNIPYLLPSDTGTYICKVSLNYGCLSRISYFDLNGNCGGQILSGEQFTLKGKLMNNATQLQFSASGSMNVSEFVIERSSDARLFQAIGIVKANGAAQPIYYYNDNDPGTGTVYYRIRGIRRTGGAAYTKVISFTLKAGGVTVLPNPVTEYFNINFNDVAPGRYAINIMTSDGQLLANETVTIRSGESKRIQRPSNAKPGTYFLVIQSLNSSVKSISKLIFR